MKNKTGHWLLTCITMILLLFLSSCANSKNTDNSNNNNAEFMVLPPIASFADNIRDISLPPELEWIRDESRVINTESFRFGFYRYRGRIEVLSLRDYIVASMQDNKWRFAGESTSKDFMLAFVKPNKACMMMISEKAFGKVELTLYVTLDQAASSRVNAFGESMIE